MKNYHWVLVKNTIEGDEPQIAQQDEYDLDCWWCDEPHKGMWYLIGSELPVCSKDVEVIRAAR